RSSDGSAPTSRAGGAPAPARGRRPKSWARASSARRGSSRLARVLDGERLGDVLEALALGLDAEEQLRDTADDHHHRPQAEREEHLLVAFAFDQAVEDLRADHAAD